MTEREATMTLTAHLEELRRRLIVAAVAVGVGFCVSYYFSEFLYDLLTGPLMPALPEGTDFLAFTGVVEPFFVYMKVGLLGGAILASPVVLYELWAFVAPGLYSGERKWFVALVFSSVVLFAAGTLFAYFVVFPFAFKYLLGYSSESLKPVLSMGLYFSLVTRLLLAFGAVFQLPLAILVLARLGIVTPGQLIGWWRYALISILIASALITPTPDVFNQLLMAGPLIFLYGVSVVAAALFGRKKKEGEEEEKDDEGAGEGRE
ncbi:MAG: twin-arginine translocase subunit TatC [Thermodesulfobacteriota bacterium]